jgi:YD repeat-containing protein
LATDPDGVTTVTTTYDKLGRVASVTNPDRSGSPPTNGTTLYSYDVLNRPATITRPDNDTVGISYTGNCATTTDEAGKMRTICADALGHLTSATEDPNGLNYQTTYTFDPLGNLKGVSQGSQTRTYAYDLLSRLTQSTTPEASSADLLFRSAGFRGGGGLARHGVRRVNYRHVTPAPAVSLRPLHLRHREVTAVQSR